MVQRRIDEDVMHEVWCKIEREIIVRPTRRGAAVDRIVLGVPYQIVFQLDEWANPRCTPRTQEYISCVQTMGRRPTKFVEMSAFSLIRRLP